MTSNCSLHPLKPLDPAIDPAYQDGPPPRPHTVHPTGVIEVIWPFAVLPERFRRSALISLDSLEERIERDAEREEEF